MLDQIQEKNDHISVDNVDELNNILFFNQSISSRPVFRRQNVHKPFKLNVIVMFLWRNMTMHCPKKKKCFQEFSSAIRQNKNEKLNMYL